MNYNEAFMALSGMTNADDSPIRLWPVDNDDISEAEARIGKAIPQELKDVWSDVGAGFFQGSPDGESRISRINALMSPDEVAEACEQGETSIKGFPFFDISDGDHLVLTPSGCVEHPAHRGTEISPSVKAFIAAVTDMPDFWIRKLISPQP